ncbi:MAG: hypothetical protein ISR65_08545 [Bacteriovoracaceae bacterium]|nr:hypothetical protein [Bacteriovoracaceae bacterium]
MTETYTYRAGLLWASAEAVLTVQDVEHAGKKMKLLSSSIKADWGFGTYSLEYSSYANLNLTPVKSIECEKPDSPTDENCKSTEHIGNNRFLFKRSHQSSGASIISIVEGGSGVDLHNINEQQPDYNDQDNLIYDAGAIPLFIKTLDLSPQNPSRTLYVAINRTIAKAEIKYVKKLSGSEIEIKVVPLAPTSDDVKEALPKKIIYDTKLKAVTKIYKMFPFVGDVAIELVRPDERVQVEDYDDNDDFFSTNVTGFGQY